MPKVKSLRAATKRFKKSASGKIRRKKAYHSHILTKKSPKRKRSLRKGTEISRPDTARVRKMLPYS